MAKDFAKKFYSSKAWDRCRNAYILERVLIDGGLCEECGECLGYIVHHKIVLTEINIHNPDISLNHENLKYVCKKCHDRYEGHGVHGYMRERALCKFDVNGQPVSLREIDTTLGKNDYPP